MILPSLIAGPVGGVISWFVTQFVPEPLRRFFKMRREIVQLLLDCENVTRPAMIEGCLCLPEGFTEKDLARLREAQNELHRLGPQMLSLAQTSALALNMIWRLGRYDPVKAGRLLMGLSHGLAGYELARENILAALRIKAVR
jgi:hypothetical protein